MLVTKPDDLNSIPEPKWQEKNDINKVSSHLHAFSATHTHNRNNNNKNGTASNTLGSWHPADTLASLHMLLCAGRLVSNGPAAPPCSRRSLAGSPSPLLTSLCGGEGGTGDDTLQNRIRKSPPDPNPLPQCGPLLPS